MFSLENDVLEAIDIRINELSEIDLDRETGRTSFFNQSGCDSCGGYCDPGCGAMCEVSGSD